MPLSAICERQPNLIAHAWFGRLPTVRAQLSKMRSQIRLLQRNPELTHGCPTIIGLIVHRRRQLDTTPQPTEHHDILRCTLQGLADLLLAKRLPGERHHPQTRPKAA